MVLQYDLTWRGRNVNTINGSGIISGDVVVDRRVARVRSRQSHHLRVGDCWFREAELSCTHRIRSPYLIGVK